jgi:glutathione S-transferase
MRILGDLSSGNCLKVKWLADHLGLAYEWSSVDILAGGTRTPDFLALNPAGQIPIVVWDNGRVLTQSNAILRYLAQGTELLPADVWAQARIDEWLFWEQNSHEPAIAVARFQMVYLRKPKSALDEKLIARGEAALDRMERHLEGRAWLANDAASIADIALLAYTRVAHEGGFSLAARPAIREWIARAERAVGIGG